MNATLCDYTRADGLVADRARELGLFLKNAIDSDNVLGTDG
jgi:hypothetical protein